MLRAEDIRVKYKKEHNEKLHKQLFNKMKLEEAKMPFPGMKLSDNWILTTKRYYGPCTYSTHRSVVSDCVLMIGMHAVNV